MPLRSRDSSRYGYGVSRETSLVRQPSPHHSRGPAARRRVALGAAVVLDCGEPARLALVLLRGDVPAAGTGSSSASAAEIRRSYSASAGRSSARRASISALIFTSSSPAIRLPGSRAWRSTQVSADDAWSERHDALRLVHDVNQVERSWHAYQAHD